MHIVADLAKPSWESYCLFIAGESCTFFSRYYIWLSLLRPWRRRRWCCCYNTVVFLKLNRFFRLLRASIFFILAHPNPFALRIRRFLRCAKPMCLRQHSNITGIIEQHHTNTHRERERRGVYTYLWMALSFMIFALAAATSHTLCSLASLALVESFAIAYFLRIWVLVELEMAPPFVPDQTSNVITQNVYNGNRMRLSDMQQSEETTGTIKIARIGKYTMK